MELHCPICQQADRVDAECALRRLQELGKLRRENKPSSELVFELLRVTASDLTCNECGYRGLLLEEPDEDWQTTRVCNGCREPLSPDRLEIFPDATLCASCQHNTETNGDLGEQEYCPRCGGLMKLKQSGGSGLTRYRMVCGDCGR